MAKTFIGLVFGFILGITITVAGWFFFVRMTVPFRQDWLKVEHRAYLKHFIHDMTTFHEGTHDGDTYSSWFTFETNISDSSNYFSRVDAAIHGTNWKLLDSQNNFRLYVSEWKKDPSSYRLEIALRFAPKTQTVSFQEDRRYE